MAGANARERVPFIGLTGGIAAGKSEALRAFERLGAATLSTDEVVHEILASDEARDELVERFGADVAPSGGVDRDAVARVVFERPDGSGSRAISGRASASASRAGARGSCGAIRPRSRWWWRCRCYSSLAWSRSSTARSP